MDEPLVQNIITILVVGAVVGVLVFGMVWIARLISRQFLIKAHKNGVLLKVTLPRFPRQTEKIDPKAAEKKTKSNLAEQMFSELRSIVKDDIQNFLAYPDTLSFEIVATSKEINFFVFCTKKRLNYVKEAIFGAYTEAEITEVQDYVPQLLGGKLAYGYVRLVGPSYAPIRTYETLVNDTLNPLLSKMVALKGPEMIAVQVYATPIGDKWRKKAHDTLKKLISRQGGSQTAWTGEREQLLVDQELYRGIEQKMSRKSYSSGIRVVVSAETSQAAKSYFNSVAQTFSQFEVPPMTKFETTYSFINFGSFITDYKNRMRPLIDSPLYRHQFIANTTELASLFHFPGEEVQIPKIAWQKYKKQPAPSDIPKEGTFIGYNTFRGARTPIFVKRDDRRRHFYIVGQTGVGKSEYLKNMFLQDVFQGEGACFMDPHGDVVEDILEKIPQNRLKDVIYWNPGDVEYPMGLNIMDVETNVEKNIIINSFIALLYKLYDPNRTGIMGPMLERTVRNIMLTAMEERGNTLIEALRLLTSPEFAKSKIPIIKDPLVKSYWTEQLARTTEFHKSETLAYYISKFDRFVTDITMRNIVGQSQSSFDFRKIMDEGKILIINLAKGVLGQENMAFLGMLIIPRILVAAMKRTDLPEAQRKDFYLYVDEFQNFATDDFVSILSEARKYRLNLIMGNQYIAQIREDIRDAVFGNVGSVGVFRVGVEDAQFLIEHFAPVLNESDLTNNAIGNMYTKLLIDGKPSEPFSVGLDWNEVQQVAKNPETAKLIIDNSRKNYAHSRIDVEDEIIKRAQLNMIPTGVPTPQAKQSTVAKK